MSRARRTAPQLPRRRRVFVFDSEALSKAVHGDRAMAALIKTAPRLDTPVVTSALTTLEAWNPRDASRQVLWDWTLSRVRVEHTDDRLISMARGLMKAAGLHGHKYAIDAVLAAVTARETERGNDTVVFTSDTEDLQQLLADHPVRIEKV